MLSRFLPHASPSTRSAHRSGVSAVEFAFVAPVFFTLIFGAIEVGRGIMVSQQLTSAARDGCRVGIIEGKSDTDIKSAITTALTPQGITSNVTPTIKVNGSVANASTANAGDVIEVTVSVPVSSITWVPGGRLLHGNLTGYCGMRRE